ncbi:MAG: helix-turn-helix transcriptional regulator [Aquabacterium sp.]
MTKTDRLYQLERLVRSRGPITFAALREALEVSPATLKRDLEYLRDRMGVPVEYERFSNGYRMAGGPDRAAAQELPGLWFDERELYALLMAWQLLSGLDENGTLARHLQPLLERIHRLLGPDGDADARALLKRVHIIGATRRPVDAAVFDRVGEALMRRRRLHLRYHTRTRDEVGERDVSPQRLVHYRSTWYLDAWCHSRERLLRFALDAMQQAQVLDTRAREVAMRQVQAEMDAGYGIFGGRAAERAVLRFDAQAAAWVHREQWHPDQSGRWLPDGRWELTLPYSSETELVMDLLRHGDQVEVVAPASLRAAIRARLTAALARHAA